MCSKRWAKPVRPDDFVRGADVVPEIYGHQGQTVVLGQNYLKPVRETVFLVLQLGKRFACRFGWLLLGKTRQCYQEEEGCENECADASE